MNAYQPQPAEQRFILSNVLQAPQQLAALPVYADFDEDLLVQVTDEAGKFVGEVIAPLNREGDEVGAQWKAGAVTMPPGFRDAYQAFWQAGWPSLACATEDGGQGLPAALEAMLYENLSAANHGWTMAPGLLHGAYECIKHHASHELKARYLEKVATGEWLATMCLTEPHAGSDLGLVRTKAVPLADGRFSLSGTKIFISGGEHDLTDNIVHLVLARLPDSPPGPKGLSLFLVPKFYEDGSRSAVVCERIEEKMGLHGSPTCVMRFDEAPGWIVGEPGKGLNAMFVMMNAARLHVGLQGIGLLDAAWQKADAYSKERRQMRAPGGSAKAGEADLIEQHPAMRRILDAQRAWIDAGRVVAYRTALELDILKNHGDAARRELAGRWCTLVTPVLKSAWTDQAFHGASACLQVFGGHGFVREWGIEQIVRDSRVAMIYEGTNEIQAIDLLLRKTLPDGGAALLQLLADIGAELGDDAQAERVKAQLARFTTFLRERLLPRAAAKDAPADLAHWLADDFLRAVAMLLMAWAWARIGATAGADAPRWQAAQTGFWRWVWPEFGMRLAMLESSLDAA
ncbi:MAG TPA: acyl-CoA dehydrogenase [Hydrogenophaga sp.]|jgi:alkylation response protein AidB-like acyl-CoA dehydrogenase|uniref:acyl-CoA dehydrogenase family protein n=1 Tax=Hydrogenophaga sp. TaxID=1904254 RepID=UPI0008CF4938|nr:acyl-CoA dehydrogenase family protein [Hydrogenophaga sp.]MBU4180953.1 acyl-CoA dehydrogenase family protein [Gammaproteobacteria bacterium]OGA77801.1 MAG: acyl-CoA dehydrogenase [Burkholderiales bacterium GWE1_65_30]OGA94152.1 MAG: acyl-CoA dehydrogenase [Burkholderiales bacterium GWF1_66_17]OGB16600.1 MAG: acyl-CoA dehydrogenase [Burkholderiales bacterium RIFCSPHIGHO2_02_FULL_66_10]OGB33262.1 MAG: acyl-CoA dehydrogenase [Burkholderiales bacterium RIFCSPLOWO2_02_FULL_66_35]PKO75900.1 MAG: